jgi:hypothetical protein
MSKQRLTEGLTPEQAGELGDLSALEVHLSAYATPEPDTDALLARLAARAGRQIIPAPHGWRGWLRLARTQTMLLHARFWLATLAILALGIVLIAAYGGATLILYALCSPVLAVAVSAYLFRAETSTLHEFELLGGYGALELLYIRLLLVLGYTFAVTLILLLVASTQGVSLVLWRLLVIWLGPMVGLTGLALYASVRWNAFAGGALPMAVWAAMLALGWRESVSDGAGGPGVVQAAAAAISQSNGLLLAALAGFVVGAVLIWRAGAHVVDAEGAA